MPAPAAAPAPPPAAAPAAAPTRLGVDQPVAGASKGRGVRAGEGSGDLGLMCVFTLNTCVFMCIQFEGPKSAEYTYSKAYPRVFRM